MTCSFTRRGSSALLLASPAALHTQALTFTLPPQPSTDLPGSCAKFSNTDAHGHGVLIPASLTYRQAYGSVPSGHHVTSTTVTSSNSSSRSPVQLLGAASLQHQGHLQTSQEHLQSQQQHHDEATPTVPLPTSRRQSQQQQAEQQPQEQRQQQRSTPAGEPPDLQPYELSVERKGSSSSSSTSSQPVLQQLLQQLSHTRLLLAGATSALVSRTAVAPLERVKMEQLLKSSSRSAFDTAVWVYQHEGVQGFWKGNALNVLRTAPFKVRQLLGCHYEQCT